jgi:hypothetical protein
MLTHSLPEKTYLLLSYYGAMVVRYHELGMATKTNKRSNEYG